MPPIEHSIALLEGLATGKHPTLVDHDTVIDHRNKKNKVLSSIQLRDVEEALAAGNKSKASRLLRYIVENEPDHDAAWMKLAELSDCPLEQIYYYKKVLHLKPLHAGVILRLESCYFEAGKQAVEAQQTSQARLYFQELLQLNPLHEDARLMLARIA
ncbi:MAG TPA: hypothetical protein PKD72_16060, partial [Gemmatales bacterium]|nr:hypothetical protein [Gemmatales bacterium]